MFCADVGQGETSNGTGSGSIVDCFDWVSCINQTCGCCLSCRGCDVVVLVVMMMVILKKLMTIRRRRRRVRVMIMCGR
ncbi:hypothetical protein DPMN_085166 [Dreissena polymorpha]|uniref:Transmembrane protein n=1 Tax=Dreissena polymorpha TaxID=45954 RepID=A0A9D3YF69_DREPO|nr:hypothetical protein DPMN_085166 [Dreissena polymorpha]